MENTPVDKKWACRDEFSTTSTTQKSSDPHQLPGHDRMGEKNIWHSGKSWQDETTELAEC